jgi:hypothetical protein
VSRASASWRAASRSPAAGDGEYAFDRILEETSACYLLGVEPADSDREGKPHTLTVRSTARDVTVRGRSWVVVPRPASL